MGADPGADPGAVPAAPAALRLPLLAAALLVAIWLPARGAGRFWDDQLLLIDNPRLASLDPAGVLALFRHDLAAQPDGAMTPFFRPLFLLAAAIDNQISGWLLPGSVAPAHLHSLLWHLLCCGLLWRLARRLLAQGADPAARADPAWRAGIAQRSVGVALLYGLHPIQSEPVLWLSARNDPMCAAFSLGALLLALRQMGGAGRDSGRVSGLVSGAGIALLTLLAGLSKEHGTLLPLAVPLLGLVAGVPPRRLIPVAGPPALAAAAGVLATLALRAQADLLSVSPAPAALDLFAARWPLALTTMLGWISLPWPLDSSASLYRPLPGPWPAALLTLALAAATAAALAPPDRRRAAAAAALALLFLAPTLVAVATTGLIGERYLYLPLAFLVLPLASLPLRYFRAAIPAACLAAALGLSLRLPLWQSEDLLLADAVRHASDPYTRFRRATIDAQQGDVKAAFEGYYAAASGAGSGRPAVPFLPACARALDLLIQADPDLARRLAQELAPACAARADFRRLAEELETLRSSPGM